MSVENCCNTTIERERIFSDKLPEDRYIKVGDLNIRYCLAGNFDHNNSTIPTVILLHGGGGSLDWWGPNIEVLAKNYRVYALDFVGAGYSDKPMIAYSFDYLAHFVRDFMNILDIQRAIIVGQSGGGCVALKFSLSFPERLEKLVLVSSVGLARDMSFGLRLATLPLIGELLTYSHPTTTKQMMKQVVYNSELITDELVNFSCKISQLPGAQKALLSLLRTNGNFFGWRFDVINSIINNLESIKVPTLIIWGRQDKMVSVDHAQAVVGRFPNARLCVFEDCGHWPSLEYPEKFNKVIGEFLAA